MQRYKDLNELLEKCPNAFEYYSSLSYDVQEMLNDSQHQICTVNDLRNYLDNFVGLE